MDLEELGAAARWQVARLVEENEIGACLPDDVEVNSLNPHDLTSLIDVLEESNPSDNNPQVLFPVLVKRPKLIQLDSQRDLGLGSLSSITRGD